MRRLTILTALLAGLLLPGLAWADNTASSMAYSLMVGGTPAEGVLSNTTPERWYRFSSSSGRSYCVETQGGASFDSSATAWSIDTVVTIYHSNATIVVAENDDADEDPRAETLSRACFTPAPATSPPRLIKVSRSTQFSLPGVSFRFRVRIVETTLYSNWFFTGGDYSSYTLLRNTTGTAVPYTLYWRRGTGSGITVTSGTLSPHAGVYINARDIPPVLAAVSGTVEVAHLGPPGAIVASTTVLSPTTGLSFDAPFAGIMGRQPW